MPESSTMVSQAPGPARSAGGAALVVGTIDRDGDRWSSPSLQASGWAELENRVPARVETRFEVGSIAKQVTAVALLSLLDGPAQLDRPVQYFVPDLRSLPPITLAQLADHESGLHDYDAVLALAGARELDFWSARDVRVLIGRQRHLPDPHDRHFYSNTNYVVLGWVIRALAGAGLAAVARDALFGPVGMTDAEFVTDPLRLVADRARSYAPGPDGGRVVADRFDGVVGPHGLWATATDLLRWGRAVRERLVGPAWIGELMNQPPPGRRRYRLGQQWRQTAAGSVVGHGGDRWGFRAGLWMSRRAVTVVLANDAAVPASSMALAMLAGDQPGRRPDRAAGEGQPAVGSGEAYWSREDGSVTRLVDRGCHWVRPSGSGGELVGACEHADSEHLIRPAGGSTRLEVVDRGDERLVATLVPLGEPMGEASPSGRFQAVGYDLLADLTPEPGALVLRIGRASRRLERYAPGHFAGVGLRLAVVDRQRFWIDAPRARHVEFRTCSEPARGDRR